MSKERYLTVLVPIKDSDAEATVYADEAALISAVAPSASNVNKIYKLSDGTYMRSTLDSGGTTYSYVTVVDREFPYLGDPLNIYDFTYDATRMGTAPTISAQNVMRYAEKENGYDVTLEDLWSSECHVRFNGENFYPKNPLSYGKSNEDARYRYDMDFISQRVVLENTYIYDVVQPFVTEKPISESASFSFFGDINTLADRINASMIRAGISRLTRKYVPYPTNPSQTVPYLSYEQWNRVSIDITTLIQENVFSNISEATAFYYTVYAACSGDYNRYLCDFVYQNTDGVYDLTGYQCKIGTNKEGDVSTSDEKMLTFENNTIHEALQMFHDVFELDYYVMSERDGYGNYTGNTFIMVADCEHDFADWDDDADDYVRDADGTPVSTAPFDYGVADELLSKDKVAKVDKLITRITGIGSSTNIPWHYPNPTPDGWIRPVYKIEGVEQEGITVPYPTSSGTTAAESTRYQKYLKNAIGDMFRYGLQRSMLTHDKYTKRWDVPGSLGGTALCVEYNVSTRSILNPRMTLELSYSSESNCDHFTATLYDVSYNQLDFYQSNQYYSEPTEFQNMCRYRNGVKSMALQTNRSYIIKLTYFFDSVPQTKTYDFTGYHYPYVQDSTHQAYGVFGHIGEDFYEEEDLTPFFVWTTPGTIAILQDCGYSNNGAQSGKQQHLTRIAGKQYMDIPTGVIYRCTTSSETVPTTGANRSAFEEAPSMTWDEWMSTFLGGFRIRVYRNQGWYSGNTAVTLSDYGLGDPEQDGAAYAPSLFDTIEFKRVTYVTPQSHLMPEVYIRTDGERRFYNAHNYYPLQEGTADTAIGEEQSGSYVVNPIYKSEETDPDSEHYDFENEYSEYNRTEHIENFDDVMPTIKEQTNTVDGTALRIDVAEEFGYDLLDNNEIWMSTDNGTEKGDYKHPYFFVKLRPLGFNIFDLSLQDDMTISMTTGHCGACNFRIAVDERTLKNPVQIWEYDVYAGPTFAQKGEKLYSAYELRRYVDLSGLYYDTTNTADGYIPIADYMLGGGIGGGQVVNGQEWADIMFENYTYTQEAVMNGEVGVTQQNGNLHFEGDVVTTGKFIERQQDTTSNYVWVALMKDTESYGVVMPSARIDYSDSSFNEYIRPKAVADVHTETSTVEEDEENADKFVLTNIALPQQYLRRAERVLSRKLVEYMYEHNAQKYNFSIRFSRIFLEQNPTVNDDVNENSVVYVLFNRRSYRQYIKHYTYRMSKDAVLPEISVDTNEELPVSVTVLQRQQQQIQRNKQAVSDGMDTLDRKINDKGRGKGDIYYSSGGSSGGGGSSTVITQSLQWVEF